MPKIVYPICCGIDVHKSFVMACIATTDEKGVTTYSKSKRFSTFTNDLRRLAKWLLERNCRDCLHGIHKESIGYLFGISLRRPVTLYSRTRNM